MKNDLIGKKVQITQCGGLRPYYHAGDVCIVTKIDVDGDAWGDFRNQGNAQVYEYVYAHFIGGACIGKIGIDFELIAEPAPLPIADAAFYEAELDKANRKIEQLTDDYREAANRAQALQIEVDQLDDLLNTPELHDFSSGVVLEAAHQVQKWGGAADRKKSAENWFWLVGYLAGKALRAVITGDKTKALHHTISSAAALANWHAAIAADTSGAGIGADADIAPKAEGGREGERPGCKHCPKGSEIFERDCHYPDCAPDFLKVGGTC